MQQNLFMASARKEKVISTTEHFEEIQEEHRKILETIEYALHKLNTECTNIFEQHKLRVRQLTEKLSQLERSGSEKLNILDCRDDLFRAKREMLCWNKANKKTQVTNKCEISVESRTGLMTRSATLRCAKAV